MDHVSDERKFREVAPSAPHIFSYVNANPALAGLGLHFEYGLVDPASARAVVKFSCQHCASCEHAVVWVSAITQLDGSWVLTHAIGSLS
ncbi:hypothetical protein [Ramlibacter sp.]|uniref:hypothetical protein n=1 Tax=Ramlibacter sp. TaxID=1917967 RepID=UPI002CB36B9F|nr:hypothetical protein [Ramlibacter sp.]HWI81389.1 hypothetical protein [Ramlibacter sp.]